MPTNSRCTFAIAPGVLRLVLALALGAGPLAPSAALAQDNADDEKVIYSIGVLMARQLAALELSEAELKHLVRGLNDSVLGKELAVQPEDFRSQINVFQQARQSAGSAIESAEAAKFLAAAESQTGAIKTSTGLIYLEDKAGSGPSPTPQDTVQVHYHGTLRDGTVFDSSIDRGTPAKFPLERVIPCWTEGLQRMKVGGKSRLVCPAAIAYGDRGAPPAIKGGAALSFEVELISIEAK